MSGRALFGGLRTAGCCAERCFCRGLTPPPAPRRRPGPHLVLGVSGFLALVVVRLMWRNAAIRFRLFWRKRILSCATSCHPGEHAPGPPDGGPPSRLCYRAAPMSRLDRGSVRLRLFARGCEAVAAERAARMGTHCANAAASRSAPEKSGAVTGGRAVSRERRRPAAVKRRRRNLNGNSRNHIRPRPYTSQELTEPRRLHAGKKESLREKTASGCLSQAAQRPA